MLLVLVVVVMKNEGDVMINTLSWNFPHKFLNGD